MRWSTRLLAVLAASAIVHGAALFAITRTVTAADERLLGEHLADEARDQIEKSDCEGLRDLYTHYVPNADSERAAGEALDLVADRADALECGSVVFDP